MKLSKIFSTLVGALAGLSLTAWLVHAQEGGGPEGGGGLPAGSAFATQYKNGTAFGGTGPGTAGFVLTSNGAAAAPTFQSAAVAGAALTRTNDTNVTVTLGGSPNTALVNAASLTLGWSGTLAAARGGTDGASPTDDSVMVGNGTSWITKTLTSCSTASSAVTYNTTTNAWGCNTISSGTPGGLDTQVQFNDGGAFGGDADFVWNKTANTLKLGTQATPPTIGTVTSATTGTDLTIFGGDCSGASCTAGATVIRGGQGTASSSTHGGTIVVRGGNADTGNRSGGSATFSGGSGAGLNDGGAATLSGGAAAGSGGGGAANVTSGTGSAGAGNIVLTTGSTARITLTGTNSASTGVKFNGYGAGVLVTDSSGNVTASTATPAITVGTFTVTYPNCCTTTPTQNWAFEKISDGTNATCTIYPTDIATGTGDAVTFNNAGGTQIPAAERPVQEQVFWAGGGTNNGASVAAVIRLSTAGAVSLGNSGFDWNASWTNSGTREWPATNLSFPSFTYRCAP